MEKEMRLGVIESHFADLIWQYEPVTTAQLTRLCAEKFYWKRTTTYTVLKRLSERGLFQNQGGTVTSLLSREEFYSLQSQKFVDQSFDGSLPAFLAAFTRNRKLTPEQASQLRAIIDDYTEE